MKKYFLLIIAIFVCIESFCQETKKDPTKVETKMEAFVSRKGAMIKFEDFKLPPIKLYMGQTADTRIRKVSSGSEAGFFFQIVKQSQYNTSVASIEHTDLVELLDAISVLKSQSDEDITRNPDYLENKFVTDDELAVGYYVKDGKCKWYLTLEKYGSDNTIIINDVASIETAFLNGKAKIEELKK